MSEDKEKKTPLCPTCLNWDPRPEDGLGPRIAYCIARDIVTSYWYKCEYYQKATDQTKEQRKREMYGNLEEENELPEE
ncbi:MAG: hypothetical protein OEV21_00220 [Thermoplasmata archaeon]|nr:hypothetical protein [Thermoplasmata archaeon]